MLYCQNNDITLAFIYMYYDCFALFIYWFKMSLENLENFTKLFFLSLSVNLKSRKYTLCDPIFFSFNIR